LLQGIGDLERLTRTLKEQLLRLRSFCDLEELRQELQAFKEQYNEHGLFDRNGIESLQRPGQDLPALGVVSCLPS